MKITSWRNCLRKHFGLYLRSARQRTLAKSACVALGLATAWGGESTADTRFQKFQLSITPAHDLLDAFVYYGNNTTGSPFLGLGYLNAGVTHTFVHSYAPYSADNPWPGNPEIGNPLYFEPPSAADSSHPPGFAVGGIYRADSG